MLAVWTVEMVVDAVPVVSNMLEGPPFKGFGDFVERFFYETFPQVSALLVGALPGNPVAKLFHIFR